MGNCQGTTCTPKLLPLPTIMLAIDSSGIVSSVDLILTISYTCLRESCSSDLIAPVPFSMPIVFLRNMKAGGVVVCNKGESVVVLSGNQSWYG